MISLSNKGILKISSFFDTPLFAFILTAIELLCYFLGLDLLIISVISLCLSFAFLFKKNLNCTLVLFLFMTSMISLKNSPSNFTGSSNDTYYFQPYVYIPCIVAVAIPAIICTIRCIKNVVNHRLKFNGVFFSTIGVGIALLCNGLFKGTYNPLDTLFGFFICFFFVVLFFSVLPDVTITKENIGSISLQVAIYALVPIVELIVFFIHTVSSGSSIYDRLNVVFIGWGNRNSIGMLFIVIFCFLFYLIRFGKSKLVRLYSLFLAVIICSCVVLSVSRQTWIFLFLLLSSFTLITGIRNKGSTRKLYLTLFTFLFVGVLSIALSFYFSGYFELKGFDLNSSGRLDLWQQAFEAFKSNIFFGSGFFFLGGDPKIQLESVMPYCCHNTIFQMLGACGVFGLISYLVYRFFTYKEIATTMTKEKVYPVMACTLVILMSLIDIYLFGLFSSAYYVVLLAMSMSKNNEMKGGDNNEIAIY